MPFSLHFPFALILFRRTQINSDKGPMFASESGNRTIYTVSKLNRLARTILETEIGQIWLSAEISNFVAASSGHWYFTLKDDRAQVKAAMFRNANRRVSARPKEGDKVLVRANIGLYEPRGDYQLVVEHLEPEGEGLLKQQFEQLKRQLLAEGLFDQQHKQAIKDNYATVGIVISATGAALHDILTVLKRRNPGINVVVYPSQVQGETAHLQICQAIESANRRQEVEILIVGRGGGSMEDLWCFNHEQLARTIFKSQLPIISAVGHEVDVTIADFVADLRAPTPSAAAELVSLDQEELAEQIAARHQRLLNGFRHCYREWRHRYQILDQRLNQVHPQTRLLQQHQYLDQLSAALDSAFQRRLFNAQTTQKDLHNRLKLQSPNQTLARHQQKLTELNGKLVNSWEQLVSQCRHRLASNSQLLDTVSPLSTLARGYNIAFKEGEIVKSASQISPGDTLTHKFVDGEITTEVKK